MTRKREVEIYTYHPCFHCSYQMPPRVYKNPGDGLNQECPQSNCKGMCDVEKVKFAYVYEKKEASE